MQFYHYLILAILIFAVIAAFSRIASGFIRALIVAIAIVFFAGFTWGTLTEENKTDVIKTVDTVKEKTGDFFQEVFNLGQKEQEKQSH